MDYLEVLEKQISIMEAVQDSTGMELPEVKVKIAWCIAAMIGQVDYLLGEYEE